MVHHPLALTLAGSDNCAGAGIQADLKTFITHGVYGLTALTAVVAEVPGQVKSIAPVPFDVVEDQLRLIFQTYPVDAWKTGMLPSAEIVVLAATLQRERLSRGVSPLVVDPVLVASSGDALAGNEVVHAFTEHLLPLASVVTPNLNETEKLSGEKISDLESLKTAGIELSKRFGVPFLMKGGHLKGETAMDFLIGSDGQLLAELEAPFEKDADPHGTGCTYSAAITAGLASGLDLIQSCQNAKRFITRAIVQRHRWTTPSGGIVEALRQS